MPTKAEVQRIQSLSQKKFRQKYGLFRAEGDKLVRALLASDWTVEGLYATPEWWSAYPAAEAWRQRLGARAESCSNSALERISGQVQPNGVLALVRMPENQALPDRGWTLALDRIRDPGNMGTLLRTADWFGASVWCSPDCVDRFNPKVVQASMGALFRVPVQTGPLAQALEASERAVFAAALEGQAAVDMEWPADGILLIGNEAQGVHAGLARDHTVCIGRGLHAQNGVQAARKAGAAPNAAFKDDAEAESLNAAVAAAILLARASRAV